MTYVVEMVEQSVGEYRHYGFRAYRNNGYSMPKGFITSYVACQYEASGPVHIEFSIQSPTGDSSDHHSYKFPCLTWPQANAIVDRQFTASKAMMDEYEKEMLVGS